MLIDAAEIKARAIALLFSRAGFGGYRWRQIARWRGQKDTGIDRNVVTAAVRMACAEVLGSGPLLRTTVVKAIEASIMREIRKKPWLPKPKPRPRKKTDRSARSRFSEGAEDKSQPATYMDEASKGQPGPLTSDIGHRA